MSTYQKTQQFLARRFALAETEITPERSLQSLGIDSLAALELLFDLEDEFGITVPQEQQSIETLGDLVSLIDQQLAQRCLVAA
jgi:acyl carrier protein